MSTDYAGQALALVDQREFAQAGDYYTMGAYQALANGAVDPGNDHQIGAGLDRLLRAALCYRRAGRPGRCHNRAEQGVLIARDLRQHVATGPRRSAVLGEFVADFHGIGSLDGREEAYREALALLADAELEYTTSFHSSPIADAIVGFTRYLVQFAPREPDDSLELIYDFAGRVAYKREEMAAIVATLDDEAEETE